MHARLGLVIAFLAVAGTGIGYLFWTQELQYVQPTPIPDDYVYVEVNDSVSIALTDPANPRPVHLHFFNPDCPCSRFNIRHFVSLAKSYGDRVQFYTVIPEDIANENSPREIAERFNLSTPIIVDRGKALARRCGVYSTPQAVILDKDGDLYFRGNYNKTRYCTDPTTNFAQMALDAHLAGKASPDFGTLASVAYGCQIPPSSNPVASIELPTTLHYASQD